MIDAYSQREHRPGEDLNQIAGVAQAANAEMLNGANALINPDVIRQHLETARQAGVPAEQLAGIEGSLAAFEQKKGNPMELMLALLALFGLLASSVSKRA
jgi:hypothetical protein